MNDLNEVSAVGGGSRAFDVVWRFATTTYGMDAPNVARQKVRDILAGKNIETSHDRLLAAVKGYSEKTLSYVEDRVILRAIELMQRIDHEDGEDAACPHWAGYIVSIFRLRADLNGALEVLSALGRQKRLEAWLEMIDHNATHWIDRLPRIEGLRDDPKLSAARVLNHDGWWVETLE